MKNGSVSDSESSHIENGTVHYVHTNIRNIREMYMRIQNIIPIE